VDMFNPDVLVTAVMQAAKGFNLPRVGPQETRRSRCKRGHPPFAPSAASEPGENRDSGSMRASHLDCQSSFDFILWLGSLNHSERRIDSDFRNPAAGQLSGLLQLEE
jgi:hypothetical protein